MSNLPLALGVFLSALVLTGIVRSLAQRVSLLDIPVDRSSHEAPTPVGGGLSIVFLFLLASSYFYITGLISLAVTMALFGALPIAVLGLVDDLRQLDIKWRMPIQCAAAIWSVAWLGDVPAINIGGVILQSSWLLNGVAVIALVWLLNLYNFMDGIDGLATSEMIFVNLGACLVVINSGDQTVAMLSTVLLASGAGFLVWNWAPAKIFLGDVGSAFIGFSLGVLALTSMHSGNMSVWTWVLLLGVFIVDAMVTLLRRFLHGDKWYEGHATHAYQNAARRYKSHSKVTLTVILINCVWLAPLAWLSVEKAELGIYLSFVGLAPLVALAFKFNAGRTVRMI